MFDVIVSFLNTKTKINRYMIQFLKIIKHTKCFKFGTESDVYVHVQ
jgi:hypothetical protein